MRHSNNPIYAISDISQKKDKTHSDNVATSIDVTRKFIAGDPLSASGSFASRWTRVLILFS